MIHINEMNQKITISKISKLLKCSSRTIYRTIGDELKIEKDLFTKKLWNKFMKQIGKMKNDKISDFSNKLKHGSILDF